MFAKRTLIARIGLSAVSLLTVLLLLEIGLRMKACHDDRGLLHSMETMEEAAPPEGRNMFLREMIRIHPNPRIIYDLRPGLEGTFLGRPLAINRNGFRGQAYPTEKPKGAVRILGLGDSFMFGWGVIDEEPYMRLLELRLQEQFPQLGWQVINTAVPGYNTVMEVAALKEKGLAYRPDFVLVEFVENDLNLPNFIRMEEDYLALNRSFLAEFIAKGFSSEKEGDRDFLVEAPRQEDRPFQYECDPSRVPPEYRDMVGLDAYRGAMIDLRDLSQAHGFRVLVFSLFKMPDEVRKVCNDLGLTVVIGKKRLYTYMRQHGIERYAGSEMSISLRDPHPSAKTHRLIADLLFEHMVLNDLRPLFK